jgi:hypothetical protein
VFIALASRTKDGLNWQRALILLIAAVSICGMLLYVFAMGLEAGGGPFSPR